jgi:DNA-directed RNA polymerase
MNLLIFRGTALLDEDTNKFKEFILKDSKIETTNTDIKEPITTDNNESVDTTDTNSDKEGDESENEQEDKIVNIYSSEKDSIDFVTRADLRYFIASFNHVLYDKYPHIKALITYLKDIASIFNKLNLPIIWRLPTGLEISQKYISQNIKKIKPYSYSDKTLNLTIYNKNKINTYKQSNALMPNLVHSLDSSTLILVYNTFKNTKNVINFYSVHDCFGVSVTEIDLLISLLRSVYIEIYSNNKYIETFDKDIIETLIKSLSSNDHSEVRFDAEKRVIYNDDTKILTLPSIPLNSEMVYKEKIKYFNKLQKSLLLIN